MLPRSVKILAVASNALTNNDLVVKAVSTDLSNTFSMTGHCGGGERHIEHHALGVSKFDLAQWVAWGFNL